MPTLALSEKSKTIYSAFEQSGTDLLLLSIDAGRTTESVVSFANVDPLDLPEMDLLLEVCDELLEEIKNLELK